MFLEAREAPSDGELELEAWHAQRALLQQQQVELGPQVKHSAHRMGPRHSCQRCNRCLVAATQQGRHGHLTVVDLAQDSSCRACMCTAACHSTHGVALLQGVAAIRYEGVDPAVVAAVNAAQSAPAATSQVVVPHACAPARDKEVTAALPWVKKVISSSTWGEGSDQQHCHQTCT